MTEYLVKFTFNSHSWVHVERTMVVEAESAEKAIEKARANKNDFELIDIHKV